MNYMKEVAQMLGVKPYEEFNINSYGSRKFRFTEQGFEYFHDPIEKWVPSGLLYRILEGVYEIVKIPKPILDEAEKEYLSSVIKPFRDRIKCIFKSKASNYEYVIITYCDKLSEIEYDMRLPTFEIGTMYKGMKLGKEYTLDELEL